MRELLLCPPDHYGIEYEINPWMSRSRGSTPDKAKAQWKNLHDTLVGLGVTVERQDGAITMRKAAGVERQAARGSGFAHQMLGEAAGERGERGGIGAQVGAPEGARRGF